MNYDPGTGQFVAIDGMLVERDALNIAEAIRDYSDTLVLLCLDPARAESISEEPFIVAERCKDGILRPVLKAWKLDANILVRIRAADGQKGNQLEVIEKMESEAKAERNRRFKEEQQANHDVAAHVLATKKSRYTVRDSQTGDLLTFYDDRPAVRSC